MFLHVVERPEGLARSDQIERLALKTRRRKQDSAHHRDVVRIGFDGRTDVTVKPDFFEEEFPKVTQARSGMPKSSGERLTATYMFWQMGNAGAALAQNLRFTCHNHFINEA